VYEDASCWARCSRATAAAFCARGTLLRGEPELAEVEATADGQTPEQLLSFAAGALVGLSDPIAVAVRRAARERGVGPNAVRNPRAIPETGVSAITAEGEPLTVGTRALLLDRRVSIAAAEARLRELEGAGRAVLLVGRGTRLAGLLAFQDGLRPGARAAVQQLADADIEPVLLSADARQTCEAIGRSLDIEHLRPEVADEEVAQTIRGLRETGAVVAVVGHSPVDDAALSAADVAVVLAGAGRGADGGCVSTVSDDVRDAAVALALAHRTRRQAAQTLGLVLGPACFGCLAIATRLLPPEYAPVAALLGTAAAVAHLRAWDRRLAPPPSG
jgi:cation transport ATPase